MMDHTGKFSYNRSFDYIGERWTTIDGDGTKGYMPDYSGLLRVPEGMMFMAPSSDALNSLDTYLRRADRLLYLAGRVTDELGYCQKIDLVHSFLLRATRAVEGSLHLLSVGDVMDAWAVARVLIERCIWMGYVLKKEKVEEYYAYSAVEVKEWAFKAAALGILDRETVEDFYEEMEDELGHHLGRLTPKWDKPTVEKMCKEAFDSPFSGRIYHLYRLASFSTHPGMDDSGEYFMVAAANGDSGPQEEMLQMVSEVFAKLLVLAEVPLTEAATGVLDAVGVRIFLTLRTEPGLLDEGLLRRAPL